MNKLHTEHVLIMYALIAKATAGGTRGLRDIEILKSAVKKEVKKTSGLKEKDHIYKKSAELMKTIIEERPFVDGNKRTAMLASLTLLRINGYEIKTRPGDTEDFAMRVSNERPSNREVESWLKKYSKLEA